MEGTTIRKIGLMLSVIFMLAACGTMNEDSIQIYNDTDEDTEEVKKLFADDARLRKAVVVFHEDEFVAGVTVGTFERFRKEKVEKELKKKVEKAYPDVDVLVSADYKVVIETEKMTKISDQQELEKKIKKIKSLSEEQT